MGLLDTLFGGGRGQGFHDLGSALGRSQDAVRQGSERGLGFLQPFQAGGTQALGSLQQLFGQDPTNTINSILGQFKESPGFKFQEQQAQDALGNKLQQQGLGGSGIAGRRAAELSSNLAQQGQQQFLQNVLGQRQQQIGGLENLFRGGLGAAGQSAGLASGEGSKLANLLAQQGQTQFGQDVAHSQSITGLLNGLGQIAGAGFGGGGGLSSLFGSGGAGGSEAANGGQTFKSPGGLSFDQGFF